MSLSTASVVIPNQLQFSLSNSSSLSQTVINQVGCISKLIFKPLLLLSLKDFCVILISRIPLPPHIAISHVLTAVVGKVTVTPLQIYITSYFLE
jgi:hypothetical protein